MKNSSSASVFSLEGIPPVGQLVPLGMQHVVAAIVGIITPAIMVANTCALSDADRTLLIQVSLIVTALATLLQLYTIKHHIGSGLPVVMGISFAYVPTLLAIGGQFDLPTILGAEIVGGCVAILLGIFVKQIRKLFPPLITGTVIFTIGLSLYPTAVKYMAGGVGSAEFGGLKNWTVALVTLAVVVLLQNFGKGVLKLGAILWGMIVGYVLALCLGMVDFSAVVPAGWFQLAAPCTSASSLKSAPAFRWQWSILSMRCRPLATCPPPPWAVWTVCPRTKSCPAALWRRAW